MKRFEMWAISAVFIALISIPLVAFAAGTRPGPNQNRPPTPLPEITVSGVLDRELTPQLDAYLEDALIVAPGAVAAEAWADVALGDNPSEEVTLGSNGWLYYTFSLTRPCMTDQTTAAFVDTITRAQHVVEATGRELIVAIAPDKASIIPEFLPPEPTCVDEVAETLSALDEPVAFLGIWDEMTTARSRERPLYFRLDTHWTNEGAAVMAEAVVDRIAPGGWNEGTIVEVAEVDHEGDLTVLLGLPSTEPTVETEAVLPGFEQTLQTRPLLTAAGEEYEGVVAVDYIGEGDSVVAGRTLVMHDSYGWALTPVLAAYFDEPAFVAETDPAAGHLGDDLRKAERIIHVSVQRSLHDIILGRDLAASFVASYADEFEGFDAGTRETGERLELTDPAEDLYVVVELSPGSDGAEVAFNEVTAVLTPDSPRAAYHVGPGGTMYFAGVVDYRFVSIER